MANCILFLSFLNKQCEPTINNYTHKWLSTIYMFSVESVVSMNITIFGKLVEAIAVNDISLLKGPERTGT